MERKFFKNSVLSILLSLGFCLGLTSCSSDGDGTISVNPIEIENYLYGKRWTFREDYMNGSDAQYSFFRNHLVMDFRRPGKLTSGMLTYGPYYFFGTWHTAGDKLLTSFTVGTYKDFDMENLLRGTLTVTELASDGLQVTCKDSVGETYYFQHTNDFGAGKTSFTDYTDASAHDGALRGTWEMTAYKGKDSTPFDLTIMVYKKGNVRFVAESEGIDFTTTYTTKNGHVTFTHFLTPNSPQYSFIYIRSDKMLEFFSETDAIPITRLFKK